MNKNMAEVLLRVRESRLPARVGKEFNTRTIKALFNAGMVVTDEDLILLTPRGEEFLVTTYGETRYVRVQAVVTYTVEVTGKADDWFDQAFAKKISVEDSVKTRYHHRGGAILDAKEVEALKEVAKEPENIDGSTETKDSG